MLRQSRSKSRWQWLVAISTTLAVPMATRGLDPEDVLIFDRQPVVIRPQLQLSQSWVDNIFYREANETSDFISVVEPGLSLQLGRDDDNRIRLEYSHEEIFYWQESDLSTSQDFVNLTGFIESGRITITGRDSFARESSILSGSERAGSGNIDRIRIADDYRVDVHLTEKTTVYGTGRFGLTDYREEITIFDQKEWEFGSGFGFNLSEDLSLFGEGFYGQTSLEANHTALGRGVPSQFFGGFIGARGDFTPNLTGTAKLGYEQREFFSKDAPDAGGPAVQVGLTQALGSKTGLSLDYTRRTGVSVQFSGQSYTGDQVSLRLVQFFGSSGKWIGTASTSYAHRDYEDNRFATDRVDDQWSANAAINYNIQEWLRASLGYSYQHFESTTILDYDVNQVTLSLSVGY